MTSRGSDRSQWMTPERLEQGYVIILPGIEGYSHWNRSLCKGLVSAGIPHAIEIYDWTRGPLWYFWNLRDHRHHRRQARLIAQRILDYRQSHPDRPVHVIGHSGGGAMTAFVLEELPVGIEVTSGIMVVPALSPGYDLTPALQQTRRGIWNYSSYGDIGFVGLGTLICGTCDGRYTFAAGMLGFRKRVGCNGPLDCPSLHEMRFQRQMLRDFNIGGHLSCVNPRFVRNWIAPVLMVDDEVTSLRPSEISELTAVAGR